MLVIEIIFVILWVVGAGIICFFPIHPIANAIATIFAVFIPAIYSGFYWRGNEDMDWLVRNSWIGWIITIVITLVGLLCNILFSGEDLLEEKTEDGKTFLTFSGISCVAYALSYGGVVSITMSILNLF